jgi:hypothetical protein
MPRVQVLAEVRGRDEEVVLTEHVPSEMFANERYADQLVERMGSAVVDAEDHRSDDARRLGQLAGCIVTTPAAPSR